MGEEDEMNCKRHIPEQIMRKPEKVRRLLDEGAPPVEACEHPEVTEGTHCR